MNIVGKIDSLKNQVIKMNVGRQEPLTRQQEMSNVVASLERMVKELRLSVELANTRYDNGYSSYLEVLDAERSLFDSEMQLAAARSERLSSIVNVCLALGGGWK